MFTNHSTSTSQLPHLRSHIPSSFYVQSSLIGLYLLQCDPISAILKASTPYVHFNFQNNHPPTPRTAWQFFTDASDTFLLWVKPVEPRDPPFLYISKEASIARSSPGYLIQPPPSQPGIKVLLFLFYSL